MNTSDKTADSTAQLATFIADLRYEDLPADVIAAIKNLFIDWLGSALAGAPSRQAQTLARFADSMGGEGPALDFATLTYRSPYFAAMINAAASHVVEQDDLHNSSVLHPATVVFSALVAAAQAGDYSGKQVLTAAVAGYEAGIRVGEFLGRSHYVHFHTTGTAGTLAACAAIANLQGLDAGQTRHAFGSAGTMAAGLWEFLATAADSKQLHVARATTNGMMAAQLAGDGFLGAQKIFDGAHGMGAGMSNDSDAAALADGLGSRWATVETSYKWHSSCRHTHPAADALLQLMKEHELAADDIESVTAHVHQAAIDVLGSVVDPQTVHQAKFSMGTVLGLIAVHGAAGLIEFDTHGLSDPQVRAFAATVEMQFDPRVDAAYPRKWTARVAVKCHDGRFIETAVDTPKGDPSNALTHDEIIGKARALAAYGGADLAQTDVWIVALSKLEDHDDFSAMFEKA